MKLSTKGRYAMIALTDLARQGPDRLVSLSEIAERFGCSWSTTTRHLNILREAKLISVVKRGRERVYTLERDRLREVVGDWLSWFAQEKSL